MPFCPKNCTILAVRPITYVSFVRAFTKIPARSAEISSVLCQNFERAGASAWSVL